ncbi:rhodanese-like domain-containing protein, partial [Chroococcidiopsis cubana]|uniref:rhodanese-like domain-containing protein n=1 Tax=Chroococcidiopsis cubana TaxID=171392 RepID=UPI0011D100A0
TPLICRECGFKIALFAVSSLDVCSSLQLDVRSDEEYSNGNVPGAKHIYVPHLEEHLDELDKTQTIATYCGSGYRASIAASILQKHGFEKVINVPGSWNAWQATSLPIERRKDEAVSMK